MSILNKWDGTSVVDTDKPFVIDPDTRNIATTYSKILLIQNDHNSERFTFKIPRFIEGFDLGNCNVVQVYYMSGKRAVNKASGIYTVTDMIVYPVLKNLLTFSWLISQNATAQVGQLGFMVRFAKVTDDGVVEYSWSTNIFSDVYIVESIDADIEYDAFYMDVLEQWKANILSELKEYSYNEIYNHVDVAQIQTNKNDIASLKNNDIADLKAKDASLEKEADVLKSRMDAFTALENGSTTGDAELQDIRVGANGTTYENAGEAVRGQYTELNNLFDEKTPFNLVTYVSRRYYKRNNAVVAYNEILPSTAILDLNYYLGLSDEAASTLQAVVCELKTPIDVFTEGGDYTLIINSDVEDRVTARFSSGTHWGNTETTIATRTMVIKPGFNVFKLDFIGHNDAGHSQYNYFSIQSNSLATATKYEACLIGSGFIADYIKKEVDKLQEQLIYTPLDSSVYVHVNNSQCDAVYENSLLTMNIPEKTTEIAEWRFAIMSMNLGNDISGLKLLVKKNTNNIKSFGIGVNTAQWAAKNFNMNNEIQLIDVEEFIQGNSTLVNNTGNYYIIIGIELGNPITYNSSRSESVNIMMLSKEMANSISPLNRLAEFDPNNYVAKVELEGAVTDILDEVIDDTKMIICWGDSLTAGGGWPEKVQELSGLTVKNCGTGGENSNTIAARQGADCIIVNNVTIPVDTTSVQITDYSTKFTTYFGEIVTPLLQGGTDHVNPCKLGDIEGTLAWTGSSYSDQNGVWTFTRSVAGDAVVINRPTQLITRADREYNNGNNIHIFFVGTNDGAFDVDSMISKLRLMIDHSGTSEYLIMGLTRILSTNYKEKMMAAFGRKWLDLHGYLVAYGLSDSSIIPTSEDTEAIADDKVPPSLLVDAVHYTATTKELIGVQVYNRLRDLHYFD